MNFESNFDAQGYYKQMLYEKYGQANIERAIDACKDRDCFLEQAQILKELKNLQVDVVSLVAEVSIMLILT